MDSDSDLEIIYPLPIAEPTPTGRDGVPLANRALIFSPYVAPGTAEASGQGEEPSGSGRGNENDGEEAAAAGNEGIAPAPMPAPEELAPAQQEASGLGADRPPRKSFRRVQFSNLSTTAKRASMAVAKVYPLRTVHAQYNYMQVKLPKLVKKALNPTLCKSDHIFKLDKVAEEILTGLDKVQRLRMVTDAGKSARKILIDLMRNKVDAVQKRHDSEKLKLDKIRVVLRAKTGNRGACCSVCVKKENERKKQDEGARDEATDGERAA